MPWFKVDDGLFANPKWLACSAPARALWVTAGSWAGSQLTDGFIPRGVLAMLGGRPRDAAVLVEFGLWVEADGGWMFHDWCEYQPTRESVLAERKAGAARQKVARSPELRAAVRHRDGDLCRYCGKEVRWNDRRGPLGGTYDHVIPDGPSTFENLVVCCRGCNASKGRRTPEQAGMVLLPVPSSDLGRDLVSDLGSARPPTRPDPKGNPPTPRDPSVRPSVPDARAVVAAALPPLEEVSPMPAELRRNGSRMVS